MGQFEWGKLSKHKFWHIGAIIVILGITLCLNACQRDKEVDELAQLKESFQAELDQICAEADFPGATAAFILADGRSAGFATGLADKDENKPMTPETRMLSGSVGKTFVAAVVLNLMHEGKLSLDDKIVSWFGEEDWLSRLPNGPDITLRMLLSHSSGLKDHVYDKRFIQAIQDVTSSPDADPDFCFAPREQVEFILDQEPLFEAGQGFAYTDTGYILIGLIIEKVTGAAYYDELHKRILDPLDLTRTSPSNRRDLEGLATGHLNAKNPMGLPERTLQDGMMLFNPANEWTGGGLITNPQDLVLWAKLLYEERALDKPYLKELLESGFRGESAERTYGLGVGISETEFGPAYGHGGWFPGYRTSMVYYPNYKIAVAIQINTDYKVNLDQYVKNLTEVLLGTTE